MSAILSSQGGVRTTHLCCEYSLVLSRELDQVVTYYSIVVHMYINCV